MARHRAGVKAARRLNGARDLKIQAGCGYRPKPGWVNIDLFNDLADFELDLRERWPFSDGAAAIVYSEHVFEHFEAPHETRHFLAEAYRVLAPGSRLSIGVPDTEWPLKAYADPDDEYWRLSRELWHPPECVTRMERINYHFRQDGEHKFAWDAETLLAHLDAAGFVSAQVREFDPEFDTEARRVGTLYVDAKKPA